MPIFSQNTHKSFHCQLEEIRERWGGEAREEGRRVWRRHDQSFQKIMYPLLISSESYLTGILRSTKLSSLNYLYCLSVLSVTSSSASFILPFYESFINEIFYIIVNVECTFFSR